MPNRSVWDYIETWIIGLLEFIIEIINKSIEKHLLIAAVLIIVFISCIAIGCKPDVAWNNIVALWTMIKLSTMTRFTLFRNAIISYLLNAIRNML